MRLCLDNDIAITAGISLTKEDISAVYWCERGGGLLSLVNTCGEIDVCPPCTEAHPLQRVGPLWVVGGRPNIQELSQGSLDEVVVAHLKQGGEG